MKTALDTSPRITWIYSNNIDYNINKKKKALFPIINNEKSFVILFVVTCLV